MKNHRRLSDSLIDALEKACDSHNELLATVLREAANVELSGCGNTGFRDRRPNSADFRCALARHASVFEN